MIAQDLINAIIPALRADDSISRATSLMGDFNVAHLPVVENHRFRGFISDTMLFDDFAVHSEVGQYPLDPTACYVRQEQHFYDVVKSMADCDQKMIAVLDDEGNFQGVVTAEDLVEAFSATTAVQSPGGILEVSVKQIDYSLAEITRLIEADGVKVLGCFLRNELDDPTQIRVTLKLDKKDITRSAATLERFNYRVRALFQEEVAVSYEKERLDALLRYLDI